MEPTTIIQLRVQLEAIKEFQRKNAPNKWSFFASWGEMLLGAMMLGRLILSPPPSDIIQWFGWFVYLTALLLMFHGFYMLFRYSFDKRLQLILEAVLASAEKKSELVDVNIQRKN